MQKQLLNGWTFILMVFVGLALGSYLMHTDNTTDPGRPNVFTDYKIPQINNSINVSVIPAKTTGSVSSYVYSGGSGGSSSQTSDQTPTNDSNSTVPTNTSTDDGYTNGHDSWNVTDQISNGGSPMQNFTNNMSQYENGYNDSQIPDQQFTNGGSPMQNTTNNMNQYENGYTEVQTSVPQLNNGGSLVQVQNQTSTKSDYTNGYEEKNIPALQLSNGGSLMQNNNNTIVPFTPAIPSNQTVNNQTSNSTIQSSAVTITSDYTNGYTASEVSTSQLTNGGSQMESAANKRSRYHN